jgi:hypothetical protein
MRIIIEIEGAESTIATTAPATQATLTAAGDLISPTEMPAAATEGQDAGSAPATLINLGEADTLTPPAEMLAAATEGQDAGSAPAIATSDSGVSPVTFAVTGPETPMVGPADVDAGAGPGTQPEVSAPNEEESEA